MRRSLWITIALFALALAAASLASLAPDTPPAELDGPAFCERTAVYFPGVRAPLQCLTGVNE